MTEPISRLQRAPLTWLNAAPVFFLALTMSQPRIASAANVQAIATYQSSITEDTDGALDLKMELNYDNTRSGMPIAVVMHQFSQASGNFTDYRANAQRLRDQGFFVLTVAMRGRDGSDGSRDTGGLEVYDIHDAVEFVKSNFAGLVDPSNVSITGYSGGGGNVMSAVTKFPDAFRAASSFFGMSDYGYDTEDGWYNNGASFSHRAIMNTDIGNPNTGGDTVLDRYLARNSAMAARNNPYTEIHLFANANETTSPPINHLNFKNFAEATATYAGEFDNIIVHTGQAGTYHDFNGNSLNEAHEQQYWPHNAPTAEQQAAAEQWYVSRLLDGSIAEPMLNSSDILFVAGFVKTRRFEAWLGDGQNAAGLMEYALGEGGYEFTLELLSNDKSVTGWLELDLSASLGQEMALYRNGELSGQFTADGTLRIENFAHGETLLIQAVPEPGLALQLGAGLGLLTLGSRHRRRV